MFRLIDKCIRRKTFYHLRIEFAKVIWNQLKTLSLQLHNGFSERPPTSQHYHTQFFSFLQKLTEVMINESWSKWLKAPTDTHIVIYFLRYCQAIFSYVSGNISKLSLVSSAFQILELNSLRGLERWTCIPSSGRNLAGLSCTDWSTPGPRWAQSSWSYDYDTVEGNGSWGGRTGNSREGWGRKDREGKKQLR